MNGKKRQSGSITVWMTCVILVFVVIALFFINTMILVDTQIGLQGAIDRGVYAGAAYLSHVMNEVAELNWKFRKEYRDAKKELSSYSNENMKVIEDRIKVLNNNQAAIVQEMESLLSRGYAKAHLIAEDVAKENLARMPQLTSVLYRKEYGLGQMFQMVDDFESGKYLSKEKITPSEITGPVYDPENYNDSSFTLRKYLKKRTSSDDYVALSGSVIAKFKPPFLSGFFAGKNGVRLGAIAAAQPYGGSIKEFAQDDSKTLEEAKNNEIYFYHPEFVPVKLVVEEADVEH